MKITPSAESSSSRHPDYQRLKADMLAAVEHIRASDFNFSPPPFPIAGFSYYDGNAAQVIAPEILDFVRTSQWRFAKTMPEHPHEYVVRGWRPDKEPVFERFVMLVREQGHDAKFLYATCRYLEIAGWKYWTMGAALSETTIINRAKVAPTPDPS